MKSAHWITTKEFAAAGINQVFHRQLDIESAKNIKNDIQNKHILFYNKITNLFHILVVHN